MYTVFIVLLSGVKDTFSSNAQRPTTHHISSGQQWSSAIRLRHMPFWIPRDPSSVTTRIPEVLMSPRIPGKCQRRRREIACPQVPFPPMFGYNRGASDGDFHPAMRFQALLGEWQLSREATARRQAWMVSVSTYP